jgi:hypothetical protein
MTVIETKDPEDSPETRWKNKLVKEGHLIRNNIAPLPPIWGLIDKKEIGRQLKEDELSWAKKEELRIVSW